MPPETNDLLRPLRVIPGMIGIELHERLGQYTSRKLSRVWGATTRRRALRGHWPLAKWERVSDSSYASYTNPVNTIRVQMVKEILPTQARILDIGIGYGYVTGMILRDCDPEYYCGVDLKQSFLDATLDMAAYNELDVGRMTLEVLDIFDIDRSFVEHHEPEVILLLEVLEHLHDPGEALRRLAAALGVGRRIIFTVPMRGRLDGVWGHATVFDRRRLLDMCSAAGMRIERALPVANTWALIEASTRFPPLSNRNIEPGSSDQYRFRSVSVAGDASEFRIPGHDPEDVEVSSHRGGLRCSVNGSSKDHSAGVRVRVQDPSVLRLEMSADPGDEVSRLVIRWTDEVGNPLCEWESTNVPGERVATPGTYVLRPGRQARFLKPTLAGSTEGVCWMEVVAEPRSGGLALNVHRAHYLSESRDALS